MESTDFLTRVANDFHLGNYFEVLEGYQDYRQSGVFRKDAATHFQIAVFTNKAMIHAMRNCEDQVAAYQGLFGDQMAVLELFLKYFAPTLMPGAADESVGLLAELPAEAAPPKLSAQEFAELQTVLKNALCFHTGNFAGMSKVAPVYNELAFDYNATVFLAYERNNQFGEADRLLDDLKMVNDEHILTGFLGIRRDMRTHNFEAALNRISEVREKFGDSLRLGALRAACLLGLLRFDEVG